MYFPLSSINLIFIFYLILFYFDIIIIIISYCKDSFKIEFKLNVNYIMCNFIEINIKNNMISYYSFQITFIYMYVYIYYYIINFILYYFALYFILQVIILCHITGYYIMLYF